MGIIFAWQGIRACFRGQIGVRPMYVDELVKREEEPVKFWFYVAFNLFCALFCICVALLVWLA